MTDLKQPLADLVEDVPRYVVPDDLAATAWAKGRRRRRMRRTAVAGAALAVVALATPVVPTIADRLPTTPAATRSGAVADGYPQRVARQWWVPGLPDAPGPVAAVMQRAAPFADEEGEQIAVAVAEDGRQWRIPADGYVQRYATISSTGRYLGYFLEDAPPFVVHDLESGEQVRFPRVTPHGPGSGRWMVHDQMPAFWSPDDRRVLLQTVGNSGSNHMLLGTDGSVEHLGFDGWAAGWVDAERIAWLRRDSGRGAPRATIVVTDLAGAVVREVDLDLPRPFRDSSLHQWAASVSPDGTQVALIEEDTPYQLVHRFSMEDGSLLVEGVDVADLSTTCPLSWSGSTPVAPTYTGRTSHVAVRVDAVPETFVASQPGLDVSCFALASRAAAGEPQGLFGTSTDAWTWWWEEALLALAGGAGLWWFLRLRRARRG